MILSKHPVHRPKHLDLWIHLGAVGSAETLTAGGSPRASLAAVTFDAGRVLQEA